MISSCIKHVDTPFYTKTNVAVFADGWMPLHHIATALNCNQQTLEKKLEGVKEFKHYKTRRESPYVYHSNGSAVQNMISKEGVARLLAEYFHWTDKQIQKGMDQLVPKEKRIARKSIDFEEEDEEDSSVPPRKIESKKRKEDLASFLDEIRSENAAFKKEMDQRIGEQAVWHYQRTPEFEQRLSECLQKETDKMLPELQKQMEDKVRRELEPVIRKQIKRELVAQVQQEVQPFRQKLLTQETQKVFSEQVEKDFDPSAFVSNILKKRKLASSEK